VAREVAITGAIALGSFVKLSGAAATGGEAKRLIQGGAVHVNGEIEVRRGHAVRPGDLVQVGGESYLATLRDAV
jgi:ribosome-associated protein